jgi:hypothetical protein
LYEYFISVGYRFKECWSKGKKKWFFWTLIRHVAD